MANCREADCPKQAVSGSDFCEDHRLTTRVVRYVAKKTVSKKAPAKKAVKKETAKKKGAPKKSAAKKAVRKKR
jgi:hypothetical protein